MTWDTFVKCMGVMSKNYKNPIFNPNDEDMVSSWYKLLKHYEDNVFIKATHKIMLNEVFAPNVAKINEYCSQVAAPIEVDDTEGWGLVVKTIQKYGYMREIEAMESLPYTVRQAVERVGGFGMICASEEPDVIRGQFYRAMAAINQRERTDRRDLTGLHRALALKEQETLRLESKSEVKAKENKSDPDIDFNISQCQLLKDLARQAADKGE